MQLSAGKVTRGWSHPASWCAARCSLPTNHPGCSWLFFPMIQILHHRCKSSLLQRAAHLCSHLNFFRLLAGTATYLWLLSHKTQLSKTCSDWYRSHNSRGRGESVFLQIRHPTLLIWLSTVPALSLPLGQRRTWEKKAKLLEQVDQYT